MSVMFANCSNSCVIVIGVEEHDGDVRFQTRSRNKAVLHMHIEKLKITVSVIMDSAVGQIPRFTERISSF